MNESLTPYERQIKLNGIRLPTMLSPIRTELARELRRHGTERFANRFLAPRADRLCNTITSVNKDNLLMTSNNSKTTTAYKPNPTKEDLLAYFSERIDIRKMTETEALRLMDVDDSDIQKMKDAGIAKTNLYKLAGNSIVVSCLYHIFRKMFVDTTSEELNLFNY